MSGFFKTVSNLRQNVFACGRQGGLCGAWKGRRGSVKEGRGRKPRGLATSCYYRGAPDIIPWEVGRVTESGLFAQWKCLFSLQVSLGQKCPAVFAAESQPVRHKLSYSKISLLTPIGKTSILQRFLCFKGTFSIFNWCCRSCMLLLKYNALLFVYFYNKFIVGTLTYPRCLIGRKTLAFAFLG